MPGKTSGQIGSLPTFCATVARARKSATPAVLTVNTHRSANNG